MPECLRSTCFESARSTSSDPTSSGFLPPSYVPLPAPPVRLCSAADRVLARVPLLRALADHRLLIFVRK